MTQLTDLRVFNEARKNIRSIARLCDATRGFGDLKNQAKRAAISVASNIAAPQGYKKRTTCRKHYPTNQEVPKHSPRINPRTPRPTPHHQRPTPTKRPHRPNRKHHLCRENADSTHSKHWVTTSHNLK